MLLTSHYMADIERLCQRILLINHGELVYDGDLGNLSSALLPYKEIRIEAMEPAPDWHQYGEVLRFDQGWAVLRVPRSEVHMVTARLLAELPVSDLSVSDPPLEQVIDHAYREGLR